MMSCQRQTLLLWAAFPSLRSVGEQASKERAFTNMNHEPVDPVCLIGIDIVV